MQATRELDLRAPRSRAGQFATFAQTSQPSQDAEWDDFRQAPAASRGKSGDSAGIGLVEHRLPEGGNGVERISIGGVKRHGDVVLGVEEERHLLGRRTANGVGFQKDLYPGTADVGDPGQGLVGRKGEIADAVLIPDDSVDAIRVSRAGREEVDDQKVDAGVERLPGFFHEGIDGVSARLVARRNEFHHRDDSMIAVVSDDDRLGLSGVNVPLGFGMKADPRRPSCEGLAPPSKDSGKGEIEGFSSGRRSGVWPRPSRDLLRHRIEVGGEEPAVQGPLDRGDPLVVEVVEDPVGHSGPIVNPHVDIPPTFIAVLLPSICETPLIQSSSSSSSWSSSSSSNSSSSSSNSTCRRRRPFRPVPWGPARATG